MVVITGVTCRWQWDGDFLVAISTDDGIVTGIGASSSDPITSPVPMHELPQARWLFSDVSAKQCAGKNAEEGRQSCILPTEV